MSISRRAPYPLEVKIEAVRAVRAGYFFERIDGEPFSEAEADSLWLGAIGGRTDEGFGRMVAGVWNSWNSRVTN